MENTSARSSTRLKRTKSNSNTTLVDLLDLGLLGLGDSLTFLSEVGIVTKDGWIEFNDKKFATPELFCLQVLSEHDHSTLSPSHDYWCEIFVGEADQDYTQAHVKKTLAELRTEFLAMPRRKPERTKQSTYQFFQDSDDGSGSSSGMDESSSSEFFPHRKKRFSFLHAPEQARSEVESNSFAAVQRKPGSKLVLMDSYSSQDEGRNSNRIDSERPPDRIIDLGLPKQKRKSVLELDVTRNNASGLRKKVINVVDYDIPAIDLGENDDSTEKLPRNSVVEMEEDREPKKRKPSAHIDVDEWATNKKVKKQYSKDVTLVQSSLLRHFGSASGSTAMSNATFLLPERDVSVHAQEIEGEEDISQPLVDFAKIRPRPERESPEALRESNVATVSGNNHQPVENEIPTLILTAQSPVSPSVNSFGDSSSPSLTSIQPVVKQSRASPVIKHESVSSPLVSFPKPTFKPVFLGSGLKKKMLEQILVFSYCVEGTLASDWNENVTHLVVQSENKITARTIKYLLAALKGIWIVDYSWITQSLLAESWLDESEFEVYGDTSFANGIPKLARESREEREKQGAPFRKLFESQKFYFPFPDSLTLPSRGELEKLIKCGGGVLLDRAPKRPDSLEETMAASTHLIVDRAHCSEAQAKSLFISTARLPVHFAWVLDSISCMQLLDSETYRIDFEDILLRNNTFESQQSMAF